MDFNQIPNMPAREAFYKAYLAAPNQGEIHRSFAAWIAVEKQGFLSPERTWKESAGIYSWMKPDATTEVNLSRWAEENKIPNPVPAELLHCTVIRSPDGFAGYEPLVNPIRVQIGLNDEYPPYSLKFVGPNREALVLSFPCHEVDEQNTKAIALGMDFDWAEYREPHVTVSYNVGLNFDLSKVKLPTFELSFEAEEVMPYRTDWADTLKMEGEIIKTGATDKQLVYGWASVVEKDGKEVIDQHGDIIPEDVLADAVVEFMQDSRSNKTMHVGESTGTIVESMMFTKELQKVLGIDLKKVGWLIGVKIDDSEVWKSIKDGNLKMFSIGGNAVWEKLDES